MKILTVAFMLLFKTRIATTILSILPCTTPDCLSNIANYKIQDGFIALFMYTIIHI